VEIILVRGKGDSQEYSDWDVLRPIVSLLIAIPLGLLILLLALLEYGAADSAGELFRQVLNRLDMDDIFTFAVMLFSLPAIALQMLAQHAHLTITDDIIRYKNRLPDWARKLSPGWANWEMRRDELESVRLLKPNAEALSRPGFYELHLETADRPRVLRLQGWERRQAVQPEKPSHGFLFRKRDIIAAAMQMPLVKAFEEAGIAIEVPATQASEQKTDPLRRSVLAVALVVLFVVLGAYFVVDTWLLFEHYAGHPPYVLLAGLGMVASVVAGFMLRNEDLPRLHRITLVALLGVALGAAAHPGVRRVNTAMYPAQQLDMQHRDEFLVAGNGERIPLPYADEKEFWHSLPADQVFKLAVREGMAGTRQFDRRPVEAARRAYYAERK
jgi:hypothetical protein